MRFTRSIEKVAGKEGVSLWMHRSSTATGWNVRLVDRGRNKTVGLATLPEWFGAEYYGYDVIVQGFGNVVVVIFEATPLPGADAPPAAERAQVAWAYGVKSGERGQVWQQIASTRNSPIDGGDRLVIRREDKKDELIRLRSSENTRFCGTNLAAYQTFIPERMAFRSRLDVKTLAKGATTVKAELPKEKFEPSPYHRFYLWYSATTDRHNPDDSRTVIRPLELGDRNNATPWVEGAAGLGVGEFATTRVNDALKVHAVRVYPGNGANAEEFEAFARPRELLFTFSDGSRVLAQIPETPHRVVDDHGGLIVRLPRPVQTNCMTMVLLDGRRGKGRGEDAWKAESVAISEVTPVSELQGLPPDVAALVVVEKLLKAEDRAKSRRLVQLTTPLAEQLVAVLRNVLLTGTEEDRIRVIPLLRSLPSESSIEILVQMFEQSHPSDKAYTLVKPALSAHNQKAAEALLEVLEERPPENERKYTDLTRMIGRLGNPSTVAALIDRLGEGSERVRAERVRSVARGKGENLKLLFQVARSNVDQAKGVDALMAINAIGRKLHYRGQGRHESSEVLLEILDDSKRRRPRLLAMKALGFFRTEGAVPTLSALATEARDPLIRRQALESLSRYAGRDARIVLEAGLLDQSPDVRIAAISGLQERKDRRQALVSIQRYAETETWRPGLEQAYTVLAEMGDDGALAAMEAELARDVNAPRAAVIAEALMRAKRTMSPALVTRLLWDESTTADMRRDLIDLLGLDDSEAGEESLIRLAERGQPFDDLGERQNERLRTRALLALGRRDSPAGGQALLRIVREGPSNQDKAIALRALAFSRDENLIPALQQLRESAPVEMKDEYDSTIDTIDRRSGIEEARKEIEELEESAAIERAKRDAEERAKQNESGESEK